MKRRMLTALALVLAACGGGGPLALDAYYAQQTKITCEYIQACCGAVPMSQAYSSLQDCIVQHTDTNFVTYYSGRIADGTVRYDGTAARACVDTLRRFTASCASTEAAEDAANDKALCDSVLRSTAGAGDMCTTGRPLACSDGTTCVDTDDSNQGTCVALVDVGGACGPGELSCAPGLYCDSTMQVCASQKANGVACDATFECESDACDGTCVPAAPIAATQFCPMAVP